MNKLKGRVGGNQGSMQGTEVVSNRKIRSCALGAMFHHFCLMCWGET